MIFTNVFNFFLPSFNINFEDFWKSFLVTISKTFCIQSTFFWHKSNWCFNSVINTITAIKNPCKYTAIVTISWPHESTWQVSIVIIFTEPVNIEDFWKLIFILSSISNINPVLEVITHVISTEWQDCKWVTTDFTNFISINCRSSCNF